MPNLKYTFQDAIREIFPTNVPEYFAQKSANGELEFAVPGLGCHVERLPHRALARQGAAVCPSSPCGARSSP